MAMAARESAPARVDLNTASLAELELLPGIGPVLAGRIEAARPFVTLDDLAKVERLGPATRERIRDLVVVGPPADPEPQEPGARSSRSGRARSGRGGRS
jgi:predicted DNA-binding helix-hairpin-helix protein